ncbi:MAG TPA: hypothetical protein V6C76_14850 [Drouetiella sp.]
MTNQDKHDGISKKEITSDAIVKAAAVKNKGTSDADEHKKADKVLDKAASEAKDAEHFDKGENDAGAKQ